ncbi:MAG: hypothetical protein FJY11_00200 [Bacteroidetes bacterium]|nr:hypothetical protein [Bacteroidota bacterium]
MEERRVFGYKGLEVKTSGRAGDDITRLLSSAVMGGEGGMQYTIRDIPAILKGYGNRMRFISLWRNLSLAGVIGACARECRLTGTAVPATFLRFLSFRQLYQTENPRRKGRQKARQGSEGESFRQQALNMFSKPHMLGFEGVEKSDRHLLYAFVEARNERTKNIIQEAGYEYIRSFLTVAFSRFRPVASGSVSPATTDDRPVIRKLVRDFYRRYSFYFDDTAFARGTWYLLRENGRIVAGVNAIPTEFVIKNVPGVWGWIMMKILPFAPWFRRLFHPRLFRFVSLGWLFHIPGRADALNPLLESVCALSGCNTALTWADDRGPLYETLRCEVDLGTLDRMLNAKPGLVYTRFTGMSDSEKDAWYEAPVFLSGFDFT